MAVNMKPKLVQLPKPDDNVEDILKEALKENFDRVIIIGWHGSKLGTFRSKTIDFLRMVGALEMAKWDLLDPK